MFWLGMICLICLSGWVLSIALLIYIEFELKKLVKSAIEVKIAYDRHRGNLEKLPQEISKKLMESVKKLRGQQC